MTHESFSKLSSTTFSHATSSSTKSFSYLLLPLTASLSMNMARHPPGWPPSPVAYFAPIPMPAPSLPHAHSHANTPVALLICGKFSFSFLFNLTVHAIARTHAHPPCTHAHAHPPCTPTLYAHAHAHAPYTPTLTPTHPVHPRPCPPTLYAHAHTHPPYTPLHLQPARTAAHLQAHTPTR